MKARSKSTLEYLYNAPEGTPLWDHHHGIPESLRDLDPTSIRVPESLIPCLPDNRVRGNKIAYKAAQDDRTITVAVSYDGRGILISFEL